MIRPTHPVDPPDRHPLLRIGQGDYARDYDPKPRKESADMRTSSNRKDALFVWLCVAVGLAMAALYVLAAVRG